MKMTKRSKIIVFSSAIAVIAALVAWLIIRKRKNGNGAETGCTNPSWAGCNDNYPVKFGSCGQKVSDMQSYINAKEGRQVIGVDGKYGCNTLKYVKKHFQGKSALTKNDFNTINVYFLNF